MQEGRGCRNARYLGGNGHSRLMKYFYFLLRRWWRVLRSSLRCFFLAIRLRRFLITEPTKVPYKLDEGPVCWNGSADKAADSTTDRFLQ